MPEGQADGALTRKPGLALNSAYEAKYGPSTRSQFAGHAYDAFEILKRVIPTALKSAKPGTPEFRVALKDAIFQTKDVVGTHAIYTFKPGESYVDLGAGRGQMLRVRAGEVRMVQTCR